MPGQLARPSNLRRAALDYIALCRANPERHLFCTALRMSSLPHFCTVNGRLFHSLRAGAAACGVDLTPSRAARLAHRLAATGEAREAGLAARLASPTDFERTDLEGVGRIDVTQAPASAAHIELRVIKPTGPVARHRAKQQSYAELKAAGYDTFRDRSADQRRAADADPTDWVG